MKKFILLSCFVTSSLLVFTQDYYWLMQNGKSFFKSGDYERAYVEFFKAERLTRNQKEIDKNDVGEIYFMLAKSRSYLKPIDDSLIAEHLIKAIESGNANAYYMMAFDIPSIETKHYHLLAFDFFKPIQANKFLLYCKALILAKIPNDAVHEEAFVALKTALEKGFNDSDLLTRKTIRDISPNRYVDLLVAYNVIGSQSEFSNQLKYSFLIKVYVESQINTWQKKGKFEKSVDYAARVNETARKQKAIELANHYIDSVGMELYSFATATNDYDADNETFQIQLSNKKSIYIKIPISDAPSFDKNFKNVVFKNSKFTLYNDNFELVHLELVNPENNKVYTYDSKEVAAFNSELITYKFDSIELDDLNLNKTTKNATNLNENTSKTIDIELEIPVSTTKNPNAYALIIGNEDYLSYQTGLKKEQNVEFAIRDANFFKEYCIKTIGIPEENILFYTNSGTVAMNQGISQINRIIKSMNGQAELLFYYAGHGYPDAKSDVPCLIPVDVTSSSMEYALPLNKIIESFSQYPSKKVILFLDACFSGGGRNAGLMASRGVKIVPKNVSLTGNVVVFSASDENQSALPFEEQKHGLFTYYLLKKLQETKGEVTLLELDAYLAKQVSIKAAMINKQEQTPKTNFSPAITGSWENWKLK
ncbi:MAG: caspase family protein [Salinivirgaceae bacterium]